MPALCVEYEVHTHMQPCLALCVEHEVHTQVFKFVWPEVDGGNILVEYLTSSRMCLVSLPIEEISNVEGTRWDYMLENSPGHLILHAKMGSNPCFLFGIGLKNVGHC